MNAQKKYELPQEALLIQYENRVCTFCGQRTPRPCKTEEYRDCDDYQAQAAESSNVIVLMH